MKICFIIARKNSFINPLNTLKNYNNKTVIQLMCENILGSSNIDNLIVMTDCLNIQNKV
jgi:CMP-N-acetylneuraminic acid synthetase